MSCEWRANLERYLDGELAGPEATDIEKHLRGCPSCAADALSRLQWKRTIHAAGQRFVPAPEFRLKIQQGIAPKKHSRMERRWVWNWVAAAVLGVLVLSTAVWFQRARGDQEMSELADLHVSTLASANPVDVVSSDRHTVKPWFQGKLPFSFNLPELHGGPFQLLGGRVTYFQRNPGAHLLFQYREHRISVFLFQDRAELSRSSLGSAWPEPRIQRRNVGGGRPPLLRDRRRKPNCITRAE